MPDSSNHHLQCTIPIWTIGVTKTVVVLKNCFKLFWYLVSSDGSLMHTNVRAFMKKEHNVTSTYKIITTLLNNTISLTGNHPLYAKKTSTDKFSVM